MNELWGWLLVRSRARVLWKREDVNGCVYSFPSLREGYMVDVAVPSEDYAWSAEESAVALATHGMRCAQQSRVQRRSVLRA